MELDLQCLFGLLCTAVLIGRGPASPLPLLPHLGSYPRALLVSQDRRHLFATFLGGGGGEGEEEDEYMCSECQATVVYIRQKSMKTGKDRDRIVEKGKESRDTVNRDKKKGTGKSLYILGKKKEGAVRGGGGNGRGSPLGRGGGGGVNFKEQRSKGGLRDVSQR